jgi:hypothetical protein
MRFSLDVLRARKGDCLMVHFGTKDQPGLIMIDGGPSMVYGPFLKPRLEQIRKARQLGDNLQCPVDLLMVSHVDDDHIQGILDLTKDMISHMPQKRPYMRVFSFWHNSFENIIGNTPKELTAAFKNHFGPASMGGSPPDLTLDTSNGDVDEETVESSLKVLASIEQGAQLRSDVEKLNFPLNAEFGGKLIIAKKGGDPKQIGAGPGLTFNVLGPSVPDLQALHKKHQEWLRDLQKAGKTPEEALSAYVDKSIPNLSSIVVLAEAGGKRMLLTGDARGDKILQGLELTGTIKKNGTIEVDILKVPHHGSSNNLALDFFQRIKAKHYVFSGNGEHGNPERETMEMLLNARANGDYKIHLTYPVKDIDAGRKADWEKEQGKEKTKKKKNPKVKVRPNWSDATNSLTAFFAKNPNFAAKLSIVEPNKPHLIDLLDPCNF